MGTNWRCRHTQYTLKDKLPHGRLVVVLGSRDALLLKLTLSKQPESLYGHIFTRMRAIEDDLHVNIFGMFV